VAPRKGVLFGGLLLILISRGAGFVLPVSSKYVVDDIIGQSKHELLGPLVVAILAATLTQAAAAYSLTQLLSKSAQKLIAELRQQVQQHIGRLSVSFYDARQVGSLVSRIMSDVEGVRNLVGTGLVQLVGGLLTSSVALVLLLRISPRLTGLSLLVIACFLAVLLRAFKKLRPAFRERRKINSRVTGRLTESLGGVRVVKGYHAEDREARVFSEGALEILANIYTTLTGTALVAVSAQLLLGGLGALILWIGANQVFAGTMSLGDLVSFTIFSTMFVAPLFQVVNISTQLMEAVAGLERTREVLEERPEDEDPARQITLPEIQGRVEFDRVTFAYEEENDVLHDVSFVAEPGTMTALVGSSGSGKSTIIGLVSAFHNPRQGRVLVDGEDLASVKLDSYRTQLGVVLQENFLFDGSVRDNVAFSRPAATEEQILEACRIARVDEFVEGFDQGYDTIVGERGVKLSGGQRQRVAIARAVLADPRILILDEATSSLDSESEALIQHGLSYLMEGRTTFVIAHRLSTIRAADQILVIEDGRVAESGDHDALHAKQGRYRDLYDRQHGLERNLFLAPGEGDKLDRERQADEKDDSARASLGALRGGS